MSNEPNITFVGNVGGEPELRFLNDGKAVCNISVAVTPSKYDKQANAWNDLETMWFRVVTWGKDAEAVAENVSKGSRVRVEGNLTKQSYTSKDGTAGVSYEVDGRVYLALKRPNAVGGGTSAAADPWENQ